LVAVFSAAISAFIAVFNLIPFAMLDGLKVLNWNKQIWIIVFALSLALLIMIYAFYPFLLT
jgi:Zn-dependent protease